MSSSIQSYIKNTYQTDPMQYAADIAQLELLRGSAISPEVNEASLLILQRYYAQLQQISKKLSFGESSIRIGWRWYTAFEKGRKKPVTSVSLAVEQGSILFNIGALYNQMGHLQMHRTNGDMLKKAAFYFQSAAGAYQEVMDVYSKECQTHVVCNELSEQTLTTLVSLNMALAQECFYHKAALDQMKDGTIAKVSAKTAELFNHAYEQAIVEPTKSQISQDWLVAMQSRALQFNAIAQFRKAREVEIAGKYGEAVGRLKASETLLKKALEFKSLPPIVSSEIKSLLETFQLQVKKSEKDNDVIYLEPVPSINALPPIDKVQLAQAIPYAKSIDLRSMGKILFEKLYPFVVHQQISAYNERKKCLVSDQIDLIKCKTNELNQLMASLGLPGSLQAYERPIGIPPELLKKSEEVRSKGGAQSLMEQMQTLTVMSGENAKLLQEIERLLNEELKEDQECRDAFKERWRRSNSIDLQKPLRDRLSKKRQTFDTAQGSDRLIKQKYEASIPHISALSSTREELEHAIPASSSAQVNNSHSNNPAVTQLKQVLNHVAEVKQIRETLMTKLKSNSSDDAATSALLDAYSRNASSSDYEKVIETQLTKCFGTVINEIERHLLNQPQLNQSLTSANQQFQDSKKGSDGIFQQRQNALQALEKAYQEFKSLMDNFEEGVKFHSEFSNVLQSLRDQTVDFCTARSLEKKDLLREITEFSAGLAAAPQLPPRSPVAPGTWNPAEPIQYQQPPPPYYYK